MGKTYQKACFYCWETYIGTSHQKYCSEQCRNQHVRDKQREKREKAIIEGESNQYLKMRFTVLRRDNFTCQYCGRTPKDGTKLHIDHINPKSNKGLWVLDNLITSCFECNEGKADVILREWEIKTIKSQNPVKSAG